MDLRSFALSRIEFDQLLQNAKFHYNNYLSPASQHSILYKEGAPAHNTLFDDKLHCHLTIDSPSTQNMSRNQTSNAELFINFTCTFKDSRGDIKASSLVLTKQHRFDMCHQTKNTRLLKEI